MDRVYQHDEEVLLCGSYARGDEDRVKHDQFLVR